MANYLDSEWIPCGWRKWVSMLPLTLTYALITFISY